VNESLPGLPEHLDRESALARTLSAIRNAILLVAPGRRPAYANGALLELTGYSDEEFLGLERTSVISASRDQRETTARLNQALGGESTTFRLRPVVRKDGSEIWVEAAVTPIMLEGDRYLIAEFRPTCLTPPDGGAVWAAH